MKTPWLSSELFLARGLQSGNRTRTINLHLHSVMLYSSTDPTQDQVIDANSYPPFKLVNSTIVTRITEELDDLGQHEGSYKH